MILDATPLIHLARIGYGWVFREFACCIPPEVFEEVVGRGAGRPDAPIIRQLVEEGTIRILKPDQKKSQKFVRAAAGLGYPLHEGEAAVLALAEERKEAAIVDDLAARKVAQAFGIPTGGTISLLVELYRKRKLKKPDLLATIDKLLATGWRLSAEDYARVRRRIEELK